MIEEKQCPFMSGVIVGEAQVVDRKTGLIAAGKSQMQPVVITGFCARAKCMFWDSVDHDCRINAGLIKFLGTKNEAQA